MRRPHQLLFAPAFFFSSWATAEPTNCKLISQSKIPYEIQATDRQKGFVVEQVYRSDKIHSLHVTRQNNIVNYAFMQSSLLTSVAQGNKIFVMFSYDPPIEKSADVLPADLVEKIASVDFGFWPKFPKFRFFSYKWYRTRIGNEDVNVGRCTFFTGTNYFRILRIL